MSFAADFDFEAAFFAGALRFAGAFFPAALALARYSALRAFSSASMAFPGQS